MDKRQLSTGFAKYLLNPVVKGAVHAGIPLPGIAILETTGKPIRSAIVRVMQTDLLTVRIDLD